MASFRGKLKEAMVKAASKNSVASKAKGKAMASSGKSGRGYSKDQLRGVAQALLNDKSFTSKLSDRLRSRMKNR